MDSLDLAGVIGTWVAAFFAIVALVGIIGPILIWRASRTDRHKALAAAANDNEFVTKGIHAGPNIWLLQRVKAPLLKTAPLLIDRTFVLDPNAFKEVTVETTWVILGHLIKAYGVTYSRGDSLEIRQDRAFFPVHKIWLLAIGLIGRYGQRKDRGKFKGKKRAVRVSTPGASYQRASELGLSTRGTAQKLHGITGSFQTPEEGYLRFESVSKDDLRQQIPDVLAPKMLYMMASGLMPLWDGRFFNLAEGSWETESLGHDSSDSDSGRINKVPQANPQAHYASAPQPWFDTGSHQAPRACQLLPATDPDSGITDNVARRFAYDPDQDKILVLDPVRDSHSLSAMLQEHDGRTYVPAESPWIRLPRMNVTYDVQDGQETLALAPVYVNRADAQEMVYSLLEMEWHPENYLNQGAYSSIGVRLLTFASVSLLRVGHRIIEGVSNIGLGALEQSKLAQSLEPALRRVEKSGTDRTACSILYNLDKTLASLCQHNEKVIIDRMIGILMMTNEEFQELFYQSLRHLRQATLSTIQIDVRAATISIPSAFGVLQTFTLDLDRMYPSHMRNQESMNAPYSAIVLASLKACVRSKMLQYYFDARPLMDFIEACPDVVLVQ